MENVYTVYDNLLLSKYLLLCRKMDSSLVTCMHVSDDWFMFFHAPHPTHVRTLLKCTRVAVSHLALMLTGRKIAVNIHTHHRWHRLGEANGMLQLIKTALLVLG